MKLSQKKTSATHRVCVYGASKSGKTLLVGKLAEHYNLLWFDSEQGWNTLLQLPTEWQERINIISIPDSKVYPIAAETWMKVIKGNKNEICQEHGKVSCALCKKDGKSFESVELAATPANTIVVFDSLTQLSQSFIAHITKAQPDDYKLDYSDWGNLKVLVEKFLSQVQVAGYNIVCITHEEETEMEDGKKKIVPVCGSSKSSRNTAKYFDHVVYAEIRNKKFTFGSSADYGMSIVAGSRTGVVLEKSTEPTLLDIFTSWKEKDFGAAPLMTNLVTGKQESEIDAVTPVTQKAIDAAKTPGQIALENLRNKSAQLNGGK